jgi:hypothetical protein
VAFIYIKRIANVPPKDLLEKAIVKGLNPYLFHSQIFSYKNEEFKEHIYEILEVKDGEMLLYLNTTLSQFILNNKIRKGDLIILEDIGQTPSLVYNGRELIFLTKNIFWNIFQLIIIFKIMIYLILYILTQQILNFI